MTGDNIVTITARVKTLLVRKGSVWVHGFCSSQAVKPIRNTPNSAHRPQPWLTSLRLSLAVSSSLSARPRSCARLPVSVLAVRTLRRALRGRLWCTWPTQLRWEFNSRRQPRPSCRRRSRTCSQGPPRPSPAEGGGKDSLSPASPSEIHPLASHLGCKGRVFYWKISKFTSKIPDFCLLSRFLCNLSKNI